VLRVDAGKVIALSARVGGTDWALGDRFCIVNAEKDTACGEVFEMWGKNGLGVISYHPQMVLERRSVIGKGEVHLELIFDRVPLRVGDGVEFRYAGPDRRVTPSVSQTPKHATGDAVERAAQEDLTKFAAGVSKAKARQPASVAAPAQHDALIIYDITKTPLGFAPLMNVSAGIHYFYPSLSFQQAINEHFTSGFSLWYFQYPTSVANFAGSGMQFTFSYYSQLPYEGYWAQLGVGALAVTMNPSEDTKQKHYPYSVSLALGRRWGWESGINFAAALGLEKLFTTREEVRQIGANGLIPMVLLEVGFRY
jgi:hypothetical protein